MDNIPREPLGESPFDEQLYHEKEQKKMMGRISFSFPAPCVSTAYIDVGAGDGRTFRPVQVYIYYNAPTDLKLALDPYVQCLWNVGHAVAPHTALHYTPHTWNHLLNMDKGDDQRKAVENHVKSMIDSCPPGFFKETVFEASCKVWMSYLQRPKKARAGA
jgi:hypothetical protein